MLRYEFLSFSSHLFIFFCVQILKQMLLCVRQSCSQSFPCAGRAVRNAFVSHGPYPAKDKIHLARIIRRSYVGVELVQWLCEQCLYVRCRTTAVRIWQVLLELGVLLSVDQRVMFSDSNSYYQFSFEECDSASCDFRSNEGEWPEAVRLLLQLAPYIHLTMKRCPEDSEGNRDICSEILQMKALERLTSTVQCELAAALARKTRKACKCTFSMSVCTFMRSCCWCVFYLKRENMDGDSNVWNCWDSLDLLKWDYMRYSSIVRVLLQ
uniref:DEP domain-containing protein n=1 Tax=Cyclopterus lumpus TaxID=8103 RepID=A0A8C3AWV6_CYCLU